MSWFGYDVSADMQDWIDESFDWAAAQGMLTPTTPLVLATKAFFPAPRGETPEDTVRGIVESLKDLMGLQDMKIDLMPIEVLPDELRHEYGQMSAVGGTWQADENAALIRYDPTLIRQPMTLISVLAHELMHERLSWTSFDFPGGPEAEELATDLHCISMGFGVIQLAGAEQAGWQGYMRQPSRAHALAKFMTRQGIALDLALSHLPPRAAKYLKRSFKEIG